MCLHAALWGCDTSYQSAEAMFMATILFLCDAMLGSLIHVRQLVYEKNINKLTQKEHSPWGYDFNPEVS